MNPDSLLDPRRIWAPRLRGVGRVDASLVTDAEHAAALTEALCQSIRVVLRFHESRFRELALQAGVPADVIERAIGTVDIDDELFLRPRDDPAFP